MRPAAAGAGPARRAGRAAAGGAWPKASPVLRSLLRHPAAPALGGFLALAAALGVGRFVYTPILPYMAAGLGISKSEAGLIASANFLGYLVGALAAARGSAPGARRSWLLGALAVSALTTGAMAFATSLGPFLALRFVGGAASALVMVFASALVLDRLSAMGRPEWAAMFYAGVGGGIAISSLAVSGAAAGDDDWPRLWMTGGAIAVAALLPSWWLIPRGEGRPPPPAAADRTGAAVGDGGARLTRLILAYGLFGFAYVITATFVSDMVRADPVLRPAEHLVWLWVGLTAAPSVLLWTWAGRRWGNERAFAAACLIESAGVALGVLAGDVRLLLLATGLFGGTFMGLTALGLITGRLRSAGDPRRALARMTASFGAGQIVGPFVAGLLFDLRGSYLLPSLLAAAALVAAAVLAVRPPRPGAA